MMVVPVSFAERRVANTADALAVFCASFVPWGVNVNPTPGAHAPAATSAVNRTLAGL
jgi:hypothetical protein